MLKVKGILFIGIGEIFGFLELKIDIENCILLNEK